MWRHTRAEDCFLRNLARDEAGNTLAIVAASILPMLALIGGGVDISRAYMAKAQLQSACDAGVLAGRRAMSKTGEYGEVERAKANSMFNFNFDAARVQATGVTFETDDNDDGEVLGTATATVPTVLMNIFGKDQFDLEISCMAELQIGNADIMFVLDVTGSMDRPITGDDEEKKIDGLRAAVRDFHKTINRAVNDNRTRIRYGFVPYSQTVNVSKLVADGDMPLDYFVDEHRYQTRVGVFETPTYVGTTNSDKVWEFYKDSSGNNGSLTEAQCENYSKNKYPNSNGPSSITTGEAPNDVVKLSYPGKSSDRRYTKKTGTCERRVTIETTTYNLKYSLTKWRYQPLTFDTSTFKAGSTVRVATNAAAATVDNPGSYNLIQLAAMNGSTATGVTTSNTTWGGCIEERDTVAETSFNPIPDEALDLDLDLKPSSDESRWRPLWGQLEYGRNNHDYQDYFLKVFWEEDKEKRAFYDNPDFTGSTVSPQGAKGNTCPAPMSLFRTVALSNESDDLPSWVNTYINNLNPTGNTYHDIGMLWGGRLTSPTGLFADNVNLDADKISVSKHIVFMTDGIMEPSSSAYSAYGVETLDNRIAPQGSSGTITSRHNARFSAICEEIKAQGTTIWVVAFGTSMTNQLKNCASGGRAYYSSNTEALRNTFKFIAAQVADLRLGS